MLKPSAIFKYVKEQCLRSRNRGLEGLEPLSAPRRNDVAQTELWT